MRTRTKWLVAGGAAAFVLTPIVAVAGSTSLDEDLPRSSVLIDAQRTSSAQPSAAPTSEPAAKTGATAKASKPGKPGKEPSKEPSGKKTVSAASPVSPHTSPSPVSPRTPE